MSVIPQKNIADTGLSASMLGLGTVKFGRNQGVKYPQGFEIPDDASILKLLSLAADSGINLLDTAPAYGVAQQRIGQLVGNSRDWLISTKVGEKFADGKSEYSYNEADTRGSVENSLRVLKREVLDIVMIHSNGDDLRILQHEAVLETLLEMKQEGKIRALGISSKTVEGGLYALQYLDVVMCTYNLKETAELPVIEAAAKRNKAIFIKKGLMSGHLADADSDDPLLKSYRHVFSRRGVSSMIVGTINPVHLRQNIDALLQVI